MSCQPRQAGPPDAEAPLARWKPQLKHNQDRLPRILMRGVGAPQRDLDNGRGRLGSNPVAYDGGSAFLQQRSRWWRMGATFCRAIALLCAGACASWACPKAAPSCAANAVRTAASAAGSAKRQPSMLEAPARRSATGIAWGAMCTDCDSPRRAKRQPRENTIRMHLQVVGRRNVDGPAPPGALEQRAALASEGLHLKGVMWEAAVCVPTIP